MNRFAQRRSRLISKATALTVERLRGRRDATRLSSIGLGELERYASGSQHALSISYKRYTETISTPAMAISLQLAGTLDALCNLIRARCMADLGSGFSSFVFARYAAEVGATVVSVDTAPSWLTKTREFLELEEVPSHEIVEWQAFVAGPNRYLTSFSMTSEIAGGESTQSRWSWNWCGPMGSSSSTTSTSHMFAPQYYARVMSAAMTP